MFGPSIGLARGNDLLCGVFFNPCADELFTAVKGEGAYLNGETIRTSGVTRLDRALATVSFPTRTLFDSPDYLAFQEMVRSCQAIRRSGSTALNLAYLAAGRFDVLSCQNAHAWDSAAGVISAPDGSEVDLAHAGVIAAATPELYRVFRQAISRRSVQ